MVAPSWRLFHVKIISPNAYIYIFYVFQIFFFNVRCFQHLQFQARPASPLWVLVNTFQIHACKLEPWHQVVGLTQHTFRVVDSLRERNKYNRISHIHRHRLGSHPLFVRYRINNRLIPICCHWFDACTVSTTIEDVDGLFALSDDSVYLRFRIFEKPILKDSQQRAGNHAVTLLSFALTVFVFSRISPNRVSCII